MDTRKYEALQKVVELSSFSKAANVLGYSQSAMSQTISSLESELGFKLVERSRSGATLTREGSEIYPSIQKVLIEQDKLISKANEIRGIESGTIRIGGVASVSAHWLPEIIREFSDEHPNIEILILQGDYVSVAEWIRTGAVDFGFLNPESTNSIKTTLVKEGEMIAILPKGHPLTKYKRIPLEKLAAEDFILLEEGNYYEPLKVFQEVGVTPNVRYAVHDDYSIMGMVAAGLGVSILSDLITQGVNYEIEKRPTDPPITRKIGVAYRDDASMSVAAKAFIEIIEEHWDSLG